MKIYRLKPGVKTPADKKKSGVTANLTEIQRSTERLRGILTGVSIDYRLSDAEIAELYKWLNIHEDLQSKEPFHTTIRLLSRCLEDQVIDEDEREEILEWCLTFADDALLSSMLTTATRRLHGVLHGIVIDDIVRKDEILGACRRTLLFGGCWKMPRCKASEILRNEAYIEVRRSDEG